MQYHVVAVFSATQFLKRKVSISSMASSASSRSQEGELEEEDERTDLLRGRKKLVEEEEDVNGKTKSKLVIGGLSYTSLLIIVAEFAERCCYYAITAVYVVYMQTSTFILLDWAVNKELTTFRSLCSA